MTNLEPHAPPAAVAVYRDSLRGERPSSALDARIDAAIRRSPQINRPRALALRWRALGPPIAAGVTAMLVAGFMVWVALGGREGAGVGDGAYPQASSRDAPRDVAAISAGAMNPAGARDLPDARADHAFAVEPTGAYSLWPTESAVFRVQARLDGAMPGLAPAAAVASEQRFWVDVRVANDGTMRIVQIVPVDAGADNQTEIENRSWRN